MEETETTNGKFKCHCSGPKITYVSIQFMKKVKRITNVVYARKNFIDKIA